MLSSPVVLSTIVIRFLEDTVTLPSVDDSTLSLIWQPPLNPNGLISHYNVDVRNNKMDLVQYPFYNFTIVTVEGQQHYTLLITNLGMTETSSIINTIMHKS